LNSAQQQNRTLANRSGSGAVAGPARIRTRHWISRGHDRIYVERDGVQLGYFDVAAATIRCEDMTYREAIAHALRREAVEAKTAAAAPIEIAWPAIHPPR
jgi:hypothetical protein